MSWSLPLNTDLRLLIDGDLEDSVAEKIRPISAFNVECVRDFVTLKGKSDKEVIVMVYAKENDRIIITMDGGFNKTNYPICTDLHPPWYYPYRQSLQAPSDGWRPDQQVRPWGALHRIEAR